MPFGNRKNILEDLSVQYCHNLKMYHHSGNLKFNNLGIFQSVQLRILMIKILPICPNKRNFTPNTQGCFALNITALALRK